jgi:hypothetical protein
MEVNDSETTSETRAEPSALSTDQSLPVNSTSTSEIPSASPPPAPTPLLRSSSSRDRYGFEVHKESIELIRPEKEKAQLAEVELLRTKKWLKMIRRWEYTLTHKSDKLRERIRKGIPDSLRGEVWKKLARVDDMKRIFPHAFIDSDEPSPLIPELTVDEIERDINRTFPGHDFFQKGFGGQQSLRKILRSYAAFDPDIGYCQGMGFIAAMFLIYLPEEEAFYALLSLMQVRLFTSICLPLSLTLCLSVCLTLDPLSLSISRDQRSLFVQCFALVCQGQNLFLESLDHLARSICPISGIISSNRIFITRCMRPLGS